MGQIQELSTLLTNQIAAGEVIERPASVVKELLENAVDAGSTRIMIDIEEAGLKKIRIADNGSGMSHEDAVLSIKRHTTSKLYSPEQLFRIRTLGFRGEALASITAVSKVTMTTSTGENVGTKLVIEGSCIVSDETVAPLKGTTIEVDELFYNTPARLKFVKSLQTEIAHITDVVSKISLSHPEIAMVLRNEGNELIRTSGQGDLRQAIAGNLGPSNARKMLAFHGESADFVVSGYTSLPELTRSNRNYLSIFINGRSIRNIAIAKAIVAGYGSTLMVGRFPISVVCIEMDVQLVDVNVHPTKQEVRISKEKELGDLLSEAIRQAVQGVQRIPESLGELRFKRKEDRPSIPKPEQQQLRLDSVQSIEESDEKAYNISKEMTSLTETLPMETPESLGDGNVVKQTVSQESVAVPIYEEEPLVDEHQPNANYFKLAERLEEEVIQTGFPELYYFGQMHGTYLFAQNETGLYMIDQHAAQERIKYEEYKVMIGQVAPVAQPLLIPLVMDFSKKEAIKLQEKLDVLEQFGIEMVYFGEQTFRVMTHPAWMKPSQVKSTIEEIIDLVLANKEVSVASLRKATAIMMSCKGAIKANHHLSDMEARQLLVDLAKCQNPYNCPHGRPVLVHLTNKDLEKLFKRIQDPHHARTPFDD